MTIRTCASVAVLSLMISAAFTSNVAEASFAKSLKKGYGGKLSSNSSTSTQQLTSDPAFISAGSVSTTYDPTKSNLVTLSDAQGNFLLPGPSFTATALVGYRLLTDPEGFERLATDSVFFAGLPLPYVETGYVQVTFFRKPGNDEQSIINPLEGFSFTDNDGILDGDDTHALFFKIISETPPPPSYTIYAEDGTKHRVLPDYLQDAESGEIFTEGLSPATVSGPVPEPGVAAILAVAGGLLMRRRAR